MERQIFYLMGLLALGMAIGIWIGWECWGRHRPVPTPRPLQRPSSAIELWESDPHNPNN